jgi:CheY-like chemotaxis protein
MKLVTNKTDKNNLIEKPQISPWKILIVDDEIDIHIVTRVIFQDMNFAGKPLQILQAMSRMEAQDILVAEPDIAVVLIDIVMETNDAGLKLVNFIRNELHIVRRSIEGSKNRG